MRNTIIIILSLFSIILFNSCREDGEWGNDNAGQFGFTIERDNNFIEKAVGEINQLKFNVRSSYDFQSIKTSFKFTTNLNGTLKLNGELLTANQEYNFTTEENIFEYVGNVSGVHELKIVVKNEKGASQEEEFELKYSISEFTLTHTGGTADIYQGDETIYNHKITPNNAQNTTGYQIRFDTYSGEIKFNGVPAQLNQFYPINNIDNFAVSLKTNVQGQGKLTYTIKNPTVSKSYEIQQTIIPRQIVIESMNVNALKVLPGTNMSLTGVIKKTPVTQNMTVEYKTWLSSASNNNMNGIQTTNNVYTPYALGANGAFTVSFNAIANGNYTLNIQAKDEYGNESAIKSFDIEVQDNVWFEAGQGAVFNLEMRADPLIPSRNYIKMLNFYKTFKAYSGGSTTISSIKYTVTVNSTKGAKIFDFTEPYTGGNTIDQNNVMHNVNQNLWSGYPFKDIPTNITGTLKVEVTNSLGQSAFIIIPATINVTVV